MSKEKYWVAKDANGNIDVYSKKPKISKGRSRWEPKATGELIAENVKCLELPGDWASSLCRVELLNGTWRVKAKKEKKRDFSWALRQEERVTHETWKEGTWVDLTEGKWNNEEKVLPTQLEAWCTKPHYKSGWLTYKGATPDKLVRFFQLRHHDSTSVYYVDNTDGVYWAEGDNLRQSEMNIAWLVDKRCELFPNKLATIEAFLSTLPDDLRERALSQIDVGRVERCTTVGTMADAIMMFADWTRSKEGAGFWADVYQAYRADPENPKLPPLPSNEPDLEIGALYISEDGETLRRIDCSRTHSVYARVKRRWVGGFGRQDCAEWDKLQKVDRDDPRVAAILGPPEEDLPYVDCEVYVQGHWLCCTDPDGRICTLTQAANDERFIDYVNASGTLSTVGRLKSVGKADPAHAPTHVRFAKSVEEA